MALVSVQQTCRCSAVATPATPAATVAVQPVFAATLVLLVAVATSELIVRLTILVVMPACVVVVVVLVSAVLIVGIIGRIAAATSVVVLLIVRRLGWPMVIIVLASAAAVVLLLVGRGAPCVEHHFAVSLQLESDLPVDELQERVFVHLVVKVVGLVGAFFQPGAWHF